MEPPPAISLSDRERVSIWVFWLGSGVIFALALVYNCWFFLFLVSILFFYVPVVVAHELGHAVAAVALGGKTHYIVLGRHSSKKTPWKVRFLGFTWYVYSTPYSGHVIVSFATPRHYRLRDCLTTAAGPLTNFLLIVFALLPVWATASSMDDEDLLGRSIPLLTTWVLLNGYTCFRSLWPPSWTLSESPQSKNDIYFIWQALFYTDKQIENFVCTARLRQDYAIASIKLKPLTIPELLALPESEKSSLGASCYIVGKLVNGKHPEGPEYLLRFVQRSDVPTTYAEQITDSYLTAQLAEGPSAKTAIVDQLSLKLLEWRDCLSTRGTRGSVLIDLGRIEVGKALLHEVLIKTTSNIDKLYSHIFLALAAKQEGNLEVAREHAQKAVGFDSTSPALKRIADLLPAKPEDDKDKKVSGLSTGPG